MPASKRFLHPESIRRIARMDLRARYIVEGFLSGAHKSPYFGQSVEFLQHREYAPGDDLRRIDWKVWAKQDRYYIKQFEEETNLRAMLLVDVSASMRYGSGSLNKFEYAATVAVSLAYLLLKQQDAVGCIPFDEAPRNPVPPLTRRSHLQAIIDALAVTDPRQKTNLYLVLRQLAESLPRRGLVILISDLLTDRPGLFKGLRLLRQRGHDLMVFHILDDDELEFSFAGPQRFVGLESADQLRCNPRALRAGYLAALHRYLDEVRRGCAKQGVDYSLVATGEPLDAALATFLSRPQEGRHRA